MCNITNSDSFILRKDETETNLLLNEIKEDKESHLINGKGPKSKSEVRLKTKHDLSRLRFLPKNLNPFSERKNSESMSTESRFNTGL